MPRGNSRLLVIDASVARAAGLSEHPVSSAARQFLEAVLEICHRLALTTPIQEEWRRHQSRFTARWRLSMYAKRKVVSLPHNEDTGLTERILGTGQCAEDQQAMLKDMPLIMAARQADNIVISCDENARALFRIKELGAIMWVNPARETRRVKDWLEEGAEPMDEWNL